MLYRYNGLEQRTYKSGPTAMISTGEAYYVYDESGKLLGEYDVNGAPLYETVYLGSSPTGVLKQTGTAAQSNIATSIYNVYADHLATPRVITRATDEAIVWRWDAAEAFGATAPDQDPNNLGAFVFNQRLPGQVFDAETGLFQNHHREYNARLGRYIQSDPIGLEGGINTYSYVGGNPLSYVDPTGEAAAKPALPPPMPPGLPTGPIGDDKLRGLNAKQLQDLYDELNRRGQGQEAEKVKRWQKSQGQRGSSVKRGSKKFNKQGGSVLLDLCGRVAIGVGLALFPSPLACGELPADCEARARRESGGDDNDE